VRPPERIDTDRLVLRRWQAGDACALKAAIDSSLAHLQAWMPWALNEPSELSVIEHRIGEFEANFAAGKEWLYGILDGAAREVLGGAGLHQRGEPGGLEIGYWLRTDQTGHGFATESARALVRVGIVDLGAEWIEIRCDPRNARSAAIPERLGFRHIATLERNTLTSTGEPRDTAVWQLTAAEFLKRVIS
jgi:RimJ/RimL family protein N-acetyltransferase